jgi:hypothetical protein
VGGGGNPSFVCDFSSNYAPNMFALIETLPVSLDKLIEKHVVLNAECLILQSDSSCWNIWNHHGRILCKSVNLFWGSVLTNGLTRTA